jgi:hypothetical protein
MCTCVCRIENNNEGTVFFFACDDCVVCSINAGRDMRCDRRFQRIRVPALEQRNMNRLLCGQHLCGRGWEGRWEANSSRMAAQANTIDAHRCERR